MAKVIRRYKLGYALSLVFLLIGAAALLVVTFEVWPTLSGDPTFHTMWNLLWTMQFSPISGMQIKLAHITVFAAVMIASGVGILAFSRQLFFLPGRRLKLRCPFCKRMWEASYDRGQVLCPHCRHLVHPKLVA